LRSGADGVGLFLFGAGFRKFDQLSSVQVFTPPKTPATTGLMRVGGISTLAAKLCLFEFYLLMIMP
jgi:hypothetical protein